MLSSRPKNRKWKDCFFISAKRFEKLRIKTCLGKPVTKELIREIKPEIIVLATGATPFVPQISGIKGSNVLCAIDILEGKNR